MHAWWVYCIVAIVYCSYSYNDRLKVYFVLTPITLITMPQADEEHKTIGYSVPATLLGQVTDTLPLAPWEFSAVCTNKTCADNPNLCYRSTQHITIVHGDEITAAVKDYTVSGVCLLQEASSKPANVFLGIGTSSDDIGKSIMYCSVSLFIASVSIYSANIATKCSVYSIL